MNTQIYQYGKCDSCYQSATRHLGQADRRMEYLDASVPEIEPSFAAEVIDALYSLQRDTCRIAKAPCPQP